MVILDTLRGILGIRITQCFNILKVHERAGVKRDKLWLRHLHICQ